MRVLQMIRATKPARFVTFVIPRALNSARIHGTHVPVEKPSHSIKSGQRTDIRFVSDVPNGDIPPVLDHELDYDANSASSAFASFRSRVSDPSLNYPSEQTVRASEI
jgi:hypothetical protein